jgi:glyoxylase-like metal-dependent hydrolase (beta-lactamase superfamily II)
MRIRRPGKITDGLWRLGTEESCIYLLQGSKSSAIISGGMNYIIPEVLRQFREFGIDEENIAHIIILHTHFDHVGVIPFFKRRRPHLTVYASQKAGEVIANPKAIAVMNQYSNLVTKKVIGEKNDLALFDWMWRDDIGGERLSEGQAIDLGDLNIKILETPGHSSCSISAYVPQLQALFPSDAAAIPYKDEMLITANTNFTLYQQSLEKMAKLNVKILGADHYAHVIDAEAANYIRDSIAEAQACRNMLEDVLRKEGSVDQAARAVIDDYYEKNPDYFLEPEILFGVYRQILKYLAENMAA